MNFEQLKYIIEVAEQGTISKASEILHVSHSAISQAISGLEAELGVKIFERSRTGSKCTNEGKQILKLSYEIMGKLHELTELGQKTKLKGELKITASSLFFSTFLPELLSSHNKDYPDINVKIVESETNHIIKAISNNQYDIGLILGNNETFKLIDSRVMTNVFLESKLMVCVSKISPLANNTVITPQELLNQPLVTRIEELSQTFWEKLFLKYGKGNVVFNSNNDKMIKNLIANNAAVGIYTEFWIQNDPLVLNGDIIPIPYFGEFMECYLISLLPNNKQHTKNKKEFLNYLNNYLNIYVKQTK